MNVLRSRFNLRPETLSDETREVIGVNLSTHWTDKETQKLIEATNKLGFHTEELTKFLPNKERQ